MFIQIEHIKSFNIEDIVVVDHLRSLNAIFQKHKDEGLDIPVEVLKCAIINGDSGVYGDLVCLRYVKGDFPVWMALNYFRELRGGLMISISDCFLHETREEYERNYSRFQRI